MTLNQLISRLLNLQVQGHGEKPVFVVDIRSGEAGGPGTPQVSRKINPEYGPNLEDGEEYISIYFGN